MNKVYRFPSIRAGLGNRILNLIDALSQVSIRGDHVSVCDKELNWFYRPTTSKKGWKKFPRPMLLSETLYRKPSIDLSRYFHVTPRNEIFANSLAIHFRGRDFAAWKKHSIIGPEFFIHQIERSDKTTRIMLFSDDHEHETIKILLAYVRANNRRVLCFRGGAFSDFSLLTRASCIVASPSTFSLCASLFGSGHIIFPLQYAEQEALQGVSFWGRLVSGEAPSYVTVELL